MSVVLFSAQGLVFNKYSEKDLQMRVLLMLGFFFFWSLFFLRTNLVLLLYCFCWASRGYNKSWNVARTKDAISSSQSLRGHLSHLDLPPLHGHFISFSLFIKQIPYIFFKGKAENEHSNRDSHVYLLIGNLLTGISGYYTYIL